MQTVVRSLGFLFPLGLIVAGVACGSVSEPTAPSPNAFGTSQEEPAPPGDERTQILAEVQGHWNALTQQLTFSPVEQDQRPELGAQGFAELATGRITYKTTSAVVGTGSNGCAAGHLCATVQLTNAMTRPLNDVWVENYNSSPAGYVADNSDNPPVTYPISKVEGAWRYGNLAYNNAVIKTWNIVLPGSSNFTFKSRARAQFYRESYTSTLGALTAAQNVHDNVNAPWSDATPVWRDACSMAGATAVGGVSKIIPTFSFFVYGNAFPQMTYVTPVVSPMPAPTLLANFAITQTGVTGYGALGTVNQTLPATLAPLPSYNLFAFWDDIRRSATGSVCYAYEGTTPDRHLVVTWKNMALTSDAATRLSFTALHRETTDEVWFLYNRWSATATDCNSESTPASASALKGGSATVGVQYKGSGAAVQLALQVSGNTAFLPVHDATCPGTGYWVKLLPAKANNTN